MGLSIIIAHYAPLINGKRYFDLLKKTITSIHNQKKTFEVEIIVCDDGSYWSKDIVKNDDIITEIFNEQIKKIPELKSLNVDIYLGLPDIQEYRGIKLKDRAISLARYEKIVILDDDHPLIKLKSLELFNKYLDKYMYVRGRVLGPDGQPQLFFSSNAQGTNYGFKKYLYFKVGGFGRYLFNNGYGEDNDILWKFYQEFNKNKLRAAYAGEIITKDLASNRWSDRAESNFISQEAQLLLVNKRHQSFIKDFINEYSVHPSNNASRHKYKWIQFPSFLSMISEIRYILVYLIYIPKILLKKIIRIKYYGLNYILVKISNKKP